MRGMVMDDDVVRLKEQYLGITSDLASVLNDMNAEAYYMGKGVDSHRLDEILLFKDRILSLVDRLLELGREIMELQQMRRQ